MKAEQNKDVWMLGSFGDNLKSASRVMLPGESRKRIILSYLINNSKSGTNAKNAWVDSKLWQYY